MKNIYWVGHKETNNVTLIYKLEGQKVWFSFVFQKDLDMPDPMWAGWYPQESEFIVELTKVNLPEKWYRLKDPGKFAIGFINAIFEDKDFRQTIEKDFKGER